MPVPYFHDIEIIFKDTNTWPKSPDRDLMNAGRDRYKEKDIQNALFHTSIPTNAKKLSDYENILQKYEPTTLYKSTVYKKDPVPELILQLAKDGVYLHDDNFLPGQWLYKKYLEKLEAERSRLLQYEDNSPEDSSFSSELYDENKHPERIGELIKDPIMYHEGPSMNDMAQKLLGDCGFVSSIASVSENYYGHNLLFSSLYPPIYNIFGIYSMRIMSDGKKLSQPYYMILDDLLPLPKHHYSSTKKPQFWYYLVEKSFAKMFGSYAHLQGNVGEEHRFGLTHLQYKKHEDSNSDENLPHDPKRLWADLIDACQKRNLSGISSTHPHAKYMVGGHGYSLIDAAEYRTKENDIIRLVRLKNPWGGVGYYGPYNPKDPVWDTIPQDVREKLFQVDRFGKEGFWMPYELYFKNTAYREIFTLSPHISDELKKIANPDPIQGS